MEIAPEEWPNKDCQILIVAQDQVSNTNLVKSDIYHTRATETLQNV